MFATLPYTLAASSLGPNFEQRVTRALCPRSLRPPPPLRTAGAQAHLTNYDINARPSNVEAYLKDKEGVGRGAIWSAPRLEAWLRRTRPDVDIPAIWRQVPSSERARPHRGASPSPARARRGGRSVWWGAR